VYNINVRWIAKFLRLTENLFVREIGAWRFKGKADEEVECCSFGKMALEDGGG
jgi:hypothetical protein